MSSGGGLGGAGINQPFSFQCQGVLGSFFVVVSRTNMIIINKAGRVALFFKNMRISATSWQNPA